MLYLFKSDKKQAAQINQDFTALLSRASIEVMPRTAAKVAEFSGLLPRDTLIYIAHLDGTDPNNMVATARRLLQEGFAVMPHFPARSIESRDMLKELLERYAGEAGVTQALVLAGGAPRQRGPFGSSMDLLETGLFQETGFTRLHVAGHPEPNKDIDPNGGTKAADEALLQKQDYAQQTGTDMAIVTQFLFSADAALDWIGRIRAKGVTLPVHLGLAGPAKLQTLIKFAIACGVGPSLSVLQKRARDLTALTRPYEPTEALARLNEARNAGDERIPDRIHIFPLGGINTASQYLSDHRREGPHLQFGK